MLSSSYGNSENNRELRNSRDGVEQRQVGRSFLLSRQGHPTTISDEGLASDEAGAIRKQVEYHLSHFLGLTGSHQEGQLVHRCCALFE